MKKTITAFALVTLMMVSTSFAKGGIIIAGRGQDTKTQCAEDAKDLGGIIIAGITGIIIAGFNGGIIIAGRNLAPVNCGIIVSD